MPTPEKCTEYEVNHAVTKQRIDTIVEFMQNEIREFKDVIAQMNSKINYLIVAVVFLTFVALGRDEALKLMGSFFK